MTEKLSGYRDPVQHGKGTRQVEGRMTQWLQSHVHRNNTTALLTACQESGEKQKQCKCFWDFTLATFLATKGTWESGYIQLQITYLKM